MRRLHRWLGTADDSWRRRWRVPRLRIYGSIGSTNSLALRLAARGAPHGCVILADEQTAGRGRRGRRWHAPAGKGLLMSFIARTGRDATPGATPVRTGALVVAAIEACTGLRTVLKWPNDILSSDGRKLAGILCEGAIDDAGGYIVIGIGVNVLHDAADFAPDVRADATSLRALAGHDADRAALAGSIIERLLACADLAAPLSRAERAGIDDRHAFQRAVVSIDGTPAGTVLGILEDGALALLGDAGPITVRSGTLRAVDESGPAARTAN